MNEKINAMNIITLKDVTFAAVKRKPEKLKKKTHLHLSWVYYKPTERPTPSWLAGSVSIALHQGHRGQS